MEDENDAFVVIVGNNTELGSSEIAKAYFINELNVGDYYDYEQFVVKEEPEDLYFKELSETIEEPGNNEETKPFYDEKDLYIPDSKEDCELKNEKSKNKLPKASKDMSGMIFTRNEEDQIDLEKKQGKLPLSKHHSFVNELRRNYPELEQDEELLVSTLANIMKEINKPPPPPEDYCIPNENKLECALCGRLSTTTLAAQRHYQDHHGPRYLICFACGTDFRNIVILYKHEKICRNPDAVIVLKARAQIIGEYGRPGSNRPFLDKKKREEERRKATEIREKARRDNARWPCSKCSAVLTSKRSFDAHTLLHAGHRPFRCDFCSAAYTAKLGLRRHVRVAHSSELYICDVCQKEFKRKSCLIEHLDIHSPVKKYLCPHCDRGYTKKIYLNSHVAVKHLNMSKPHPCKVCPKRFSRFSSLSFHMKNKHGMIIMTRKALLNKLPTMSEADLVNAKLVFDGVVQRKSGEVK